MIILCLCIMISLCQDMMLNLNKHMKIKKFQSPAGPIEYQQRVGGAFSVNDPITAGYDEGADRRQLYDVSYSMPYQLTNAGLWMAAPYTYGITAIPASLMSSAAIVSDANDIADNGIGVGNGFNTVFDVLTPLPSIAAVRQISNAAGVANAAENAFRAATTTHDASWNAYHLANDALTKGLKTTAKAKAKKDALGRVAFAGNQAAASAYKKAAQQATQAIENANIIPGKPLNIFVQSPLTGEIGILNKYVTVENAAKNNLIRGRLANNFIKRGLAEDAARKAVLKAGEKSGQAAEAYSEALKWRPLGIASGTFECERQVFNAGSDYVAK